MQTRTQPDRHANEEACHDPKISRSTNGSTHRWRPTDEPCTCATSHLSSPTRARTASPSTSTCPSKVGTGRRCFGISGVCIFLSGKAQDDPLHMSGILSVKYIDLPPAASYRDDDHFSQSPSNLSSIALIHKLL